MSDPNPPPGETTPATAPDHAAASSPGPSPGSDDLRKDLAGSVAWSFQALVAAAAFCGITAASHGDWELLEGATHAASATGDIEVPIVGLKVVLLAFFVVGPAVLLSMQIYLQVQSRALMRLPGGTEANGLLHNHVQLWPLSLLGIASFVVVPLADAFFLWKIWPRRYADDLLIPATDVRINTLTFLVAAFFLAACFVSILGARSDWRCLHSLPHVHQRPRGFNRRALAGSGLVLAGLVVGFGVVLAGRHLQMRKAPLERADLRYFDLRGADLQEARLQGAAMSGAMMGGAMLAGASLDHADLRGVELSGADLTFARLNEADLSGACLIGARLSQVEIEGARFTYAWLPGAIIEPRPRTRADRVAPATAEERAYESRGAIEAVDFSKVKLCGAHISAAHWAKEVATGSPEPGTGRPFFDAGDTGDGRLVPGSFDAQPYPADLEATPAARERFLKAALAQCIASLKPVGIADSCPDGGRQ